MGLIIKETKDKKITISGTNINIPQIYGRISFVGYADGKILEIGIGLFASNETFKNNQPIFTNIPAGNLKIELLPNENQTIENAHKYMKKAIEDLGFIVEIDLI